METRVNDIFETERLNAFDKFYVASLFFYCFLLFSPTIYTIIPFSGAMANGIRLFIALVLTVYAVQQAVRRGSVKINKGLLLLSFAFVMSLLIPTAYHQTTYLLVNEFLGFYLVYMFFLFYRKKHLQPLITIATVFMFVTLIFAVIGFLYALSGRPPQFFGISDDGRGYYWYLTTGAVETGMFGNIIRPQGIYDEPGGLSYVLCTLCFLRLFTKRRDSVTFALMLLGNITFSMIHMMLFALFIAHLAIQYRMKKIFAVYALVIITVMAAVYLPVREYANEHLFARFAVTQGIGFAGNNRAYTMGNALQLAKENRYPFVWGLPRDERGLTAMDRSWIYGHNPLAPALKFGIFASWLYYFYLMYFVMCGVVDRRNFLIYLSILLMFLQRPEFYRGGTTAAVLLLFFTSWEMVKHCIGKYRVAACQLSPS